MQPERFGRYVNMHLTAPGFGAVPFVEIASMIALATPTRIRGPCGQQLALQVRFHADDKRLPVVTLRRVA